MLENETPSALCRITEVEITVTDALYYMCSGQCMVDGRICMNGPSQTGNLGGYRRLECDGVQGELIYCDKILLIVGQLLQKVLLTYW